MTRDCGNHAWLAGTQLLIPTEYCCIVLFTAKTGCDAIKNKRRLQTLESIPKLAVGRPKKTSGYLVDTPRISKDSKKQRKRIKQEHQKIRTKFTNIDLIDAPI